MVFCPELITHRSNSGLITRVFLCRKLKLRDINFSHFMRLCLYSLKSRENKMFTEIFTNTRNIRNSVCIPLATTIHSYATRYIFSECPHFVYLHTYAYKSKILSRCDGVKFRNFTTLAKRNSQESR